MTSEVVLDDYQQVVLSDATVVASGSSMVAMDFGHKETTLLINITAAPTGTLPTITFTLEEIDPGNGTTVLGTTVTGAPLSTATTQILSLPVTYGGNVLVTWTVAGSTPSFTGIYATLVNKGPSPAIYDQAGNGPVAVKPGNVAALATDPALVVSPSPNLPKTPTLSSASVNASTVGDNTLVTGVGGETIRVFKVVLVFSEAGTAIFQDGNTALTGPLVMSAGGSIVLDMDVTNPWFLTSAGNNFILNLSGGAVGGVIYYTQSS